MVEAKCGETHKDQDNILNYRNFGEKMEPDIKCGATHKDYRREATESVLSDTPVLRHVLSQSFLFRRQVQTKVEVLVQVLTGTG